MLPETETQILRKCFTFVRSKLIILNNKYRSNEKVNHNGGLVFRAK